MVMTARVFPSTMSIWEPLHFLYSVMWAWTLFFVVKPTISKTVYFCACNPVAIAMHFAVSTLSPVNIHTWMSAWRIFWIVRVTFSWSRSSTPVTQRNSMFISRRWISAWISSSLFVKEVLALSMFLENSSYSYWLNSFYVITSVLSPSVAKFSHIS